jgi:hypothetical protein
MVGQVEPDQTAVAGVASLGEQARGHHPVRRFDDRRRAHVESLGELPGRYPIASPENLEDKVLADADTVAAHLLVGRHAP